MTDMKGFLLAAYRSIAKTTRLTKITRNAMISYLLLLVIIPPIFIMVAFFVSPVKTAGFFNFEVNKSQASSENPNSKVLAASTESQGSVLATYTAAALEPQAVAAVKALRVIASNTVTGVVLPAEQGGITQTVQTTVPGLPGIDGATGSTGATGATGSDGVDGTDGTSVVDVMTTAGDVIIRNAGNATARLAAGLDGQVLTITSGIPSWEDSTGGGLIDASSLNSVALGITTATSGNLLIGSGTQWVTQAMSGEATIDGSGALTINYVAAQAADATHKGFLTALDWNTFNSKQDAFSFTPEDVVNKSSSTSLGTSDTLYPSQNAVKTYVDNNAIGLNWKTSLEAINVIANSATPIGAPVEGDAYIIDTGGDIGAWASFDPGDIVQFQTGVWVKLKSLAVGDRFGIAFRSSSTPSGTFTGSNNHVFDVSGGTPGAFTYIDVAPLNGDARFVSNSVSFYNGISFTYSTSLGEWVQLSATVNISYGSGLEDLVNILHLGPLTEDWNQTGLFAINTAGTITSAGLFTASNGLTQTTGVLGLTVTSGNINSSGVLNFTSGAASTWTLANVSDALNFDSNTLSIDALNNRVGMGTSTPGFGLSVLGNSSTGNIASFTNLNSTVNTTASVLRLGIGVTTTTNIPRFVQFYQASTTDSNGTGVGYIRLNNNGVSFVSGTADFAEWTEVTDSPAAGDIIQSVSAGNQKALPGNLLLGVVTDSAIIIGNETSDNTGKAIIGFLGRVNTKVSNENGDIAIGDPIAASSVAGVGMKQTKAGPTIGKALAAKTGATLERIAVQVVPGWFDPDPLLTAGNFNISGSDVLDINSAVVTRVGGFQDIFAGGLTLATGLTNDNLANSGLVLAGNSGSGSVSLGDTLTFTGAGITNVVASGGTLTVTSTEVDTLATVTGRGASTSTALTLDGGINTTTSNINFTVGDTASGGKVQVGNSGTTTPDLLVLDNGTADPTGVNGGMYYNTSINKFRCYENSAWKNCDTAGAGSDLQYVTSYKTNDTLTNITSSVTTLTTVSIIPATATGDVMVRAGVTFVSSNNETQPFTIAIRQTDCTGTILQTTTYSIALDANADQEQHLDLNYVAVDPGNSSQTYAFCASTSAGDTDVVDWNMSAIVIDTGADLAEIYTTNDRSIEVKDVVSIDTGLKTGMKKSMTPYDQNVIGIISTNPGIVIGSVDKEGVKALPVALSGRVPVKVSGENGAIKAGDYLTTSNTPGVAMKATATGAIIGTAMTSFDGDGVGTVIVFVKNGSSSSPVEPETLLNKLFDQLIAWFANATNKIGDFFAKKVHTDEICLKRSDGSEACINGDQLDKLIPLVTVPTTTTEPTSTELASPSAQTL